MSPTETLAQLGEFGFLRQVWARQERDARVLVGPGDDAAVVQAGGAVLVLTVDAMQEDVHFRSDWWTPQEIGSRACAAALSDLAAMGARPLAVLVSWSCPADTTTDDAHGLLAGIRQAAAEAGAMLVGGDMAGSGRLWLDISAVGLQQAGRCLLRSGARPGDRLYVSGTLGDSALAVRLAERGALDRRRPEHEYLVQRHVRPTPRLAVSDLLVREPAVHAALDLSDGLGQDAGHLAAASECRVVLRARDLPVSAELRAVAPGLDLDLTALALTGGEDYELLWAVAPDQGARVARRITTKTEIPVTEVGDIQAGAGVIVIEPDGTQHSLEHGGWDHFRQD